LMVVVAYDISRDDARLKAARILQAMGFARIQRSVYVARGGAAKARDAARALARILNEDTDRADIILIPDHLWRGRITLGGERRFENRPTIQLTP
jgi:CRISPR-associated protein Cas2